jgi:hypothetical protein
LVCELLYALVEAHAMTPVVGVYKSRYAAELGIDRIMTMGIVREKINILTPNSTDAQVAAVATSDTEQSGMGAAVGKVVGGSIGAAGGFGAGAALASLLLPGVGPILAGGMIGAGLLGLGGAAGGSAAGEALEDEISGIPRDELYVYEDALRQGKTVVIAEAEDERHAEAVRRGFEESSAESIDAARDHWWIGLRSSERELYTEADFEQDEPHFRKGFEAAQSPALRGKSYREAQDYLTRRNEIAASHAAFRRGYERGLRYQEGVLDRRKSA